MKVFTATAAVAAALAACAVFAPSVSADNHSGFAPIPAKTTLIQYSGQYEDMLFPFGSCQNIKFTGDVIAAEKKLQVSCYKNSVEKGSVNCIVQGLGKPTCDVVSTRCTKTYKGKWVPSPDGTWCKPV
ncbi:hypothetical protein GQ42DRAFT_163377 [Ramicandelaber brevisporus]|nr:hypothetical protein GQ42DRAFT_163377 [Ramicandelaber brevisporus]